MKIYFAGVKRAYLQDLEPHDSILVSYASSHESSLINHVPHEVIVDSGAFTFWRSGRKIENYENEVRTYCDFLKAKGLPDCIAMDVIGGDADSQIQNLNYMIQNGIENTWPVFHEGDDFELLNEYKRMGFKKICIGGTVSRGKPALIDWIYKVMSHSPPSANLRYHGLAMTQQYIFEYMQSYFDSVDSTTWLSLAKYGLKGASHLVKGRSIEFYRKTGRLAMLDMLSGQRGIPEKVDQLNFLDMLE